MNTGPVWREGGGPGNTETGRTTNFMSPQAIPRATKNHKILKTRDLQILEGRYGAQIDRFWREGGELKLCLNSSRSVLRSAPFLTRCEANIFSACGIRTTPSAHRTIPSRGLKAGDLLASGAPSSEQSQAVQERLDPVFGALSFWRVSLHEAIELGNAGLGLLGHGLPTSYDKRRACGIEGKEWRDSQLA